MIRGVIVRPLSSTTARPVIASSLRVCTPFTIMPATSSVGSSYVRCASSSVMASRRVPSHLSALWSQQLSAVTSLANTRPSITAAATLVRGLASRDDGHHSDSDGGFSDNERRSNSNTAVKGAKRTRCVAYAIPGKYKLKVIEKAFENPSRSKKGASHYRHFMRPLPDLNASAEVYFFSTGTMVAWNVSPEEEKKLLARIPVDAVPDGGQLAVDIEVAPESYPVVQGTAAETSIEGDLITLGSNINSDTKLAVSLALAASVKASVIESGGDKILELLRELSRGDNASEKTIISNFYQRKDIKPLLTKFRLSLLNIKNTQFSLSGDNDYFWDVPTDEQNVYRRVKNYLDVGKRVKVAGDTVDHALDLASSLLSDVQHKHSIRLENIIIALIAVEVVFGFVDHWDSVIRGTFLKLLALFK